VTHADATLTALLRDVLDAPDDDGARLRYADRLDELGDPERADFIRVQIEVHHRCWNEAYQCPVELFSPEDLPAVNALRLRERELLFSLPGSLWLGDWEPNPDRITHGELTHNGRPCVLVRRGFVESVTCTAADWMEHAAAILAAHPVRKVRLTELNYHPDAANFRLSRAEYGIWISHRYPGVTFYLPATTRDGAFIVPEHLAPAIEALAQQGVYP
jgi:uncharacterized protein (TIGR02996 family)